MEETINATVQKFISDYHDDNPLKTRLELPNYDSTFNANNEKM